MKKNGNLVRVLVCCKRSMRIREVFAQPGDFHDNCFSMEFMDQDKGKLDLFLKKYEQIGAYCGGFFCDYHDCYGDGSYVMYNLGGKTHRIPFVPFSEMSEDASFDSTLAMMKHDGYGLHQRMEEMSVFDLVQKLIELGCVFNEDEKRRLIECGVLVYQDGEQSKCVAFDRNGVFEMDAHISKEEIFCGNYLEDLDYAILNEKLIQNPLLKALLSYPSLISVECNVTERNSDYLKIHVCSQIEVCPKSEMDASTLDWKFSEKVEDSLCIELKNGIFSFMPPVGYECLNCEDKVAKFIPEALMDEDEPSIQFSFVSMSEDKKKQNQVLREVLDQGRVFQIDDKLVELSSLDMMVYKLIAFTVKKGMHTALFQVMIKDMDLFDEKVIEDSIYRFIENCGFYSYKDLKRMIFR